MTCSLTLDAFSSNSMNGYLGILVKGVTSNFEPFTCLIACRNIVSSQTASKIAEIYNDVQEWGISTKVKQNKIKV